ncbi:DUF4269 domain-containing protein [Reyranella sp.]|uniref:DUF4269 domain-containing protein n=1 Tax=Reyranella sp. TaxID=1929291 RepID=UPI003D13B5F1
MPRPHYLTVLDRSGLLTALARFDPHVAGTPPLGLDLPGSDIDVICQATDAEAFTKTLWDFASPFDGFTIHQWTNDGRPVVASFHLDGWPVEVFGDPRPVAGQPGLRHFEIERRLLALGGHGLRAAVMQCRREGLKTEPAFARVLGLEGDPYAALLALEQMPDADVVRMLNACLT